MLKFRKVLSKISLAVFVIALTLCLAFVGYVGFSKIILKKQLPDFFGYSFVIIVSDSMNPTIEKGDMVLIKRHDVYETNDIITFNDPIGLVTHRIISVEENGFQTKGDNNPSKDLTIVKFDDVYGSVVKVTKGFGTRLQFIIQPYNLAMIVCLIGAIVLFFDIWKKTYIIGKQIDYKNDYRFFSTQFEEKQYNNHNKEV